MSIHSRMRSMVAATAALAVAGGLGLAVGGSPASLADESTRIQAQSATLPATTYAVIKTIGVGSSAESVAINDSDDTVYVSQNSGMTVIDGNTGLVSAVVPVGGNTGGVGVNQTDDTVFIGGRSPTQLVAFNGRNLDDTAAVAISNSPNSVAVSDFDDSIFVANSPLLTMIRASTMTLVKSVNIPGSPESVALNQADDTVYVTDRFTDTLSVLNARDLDDSRVVLGFSEPRGVAVNQDDDTVYVTNRDSDELVVMRGRNLDDSVTIPVGDGPRHVAVDQLDDTVYVTNSSSDNMTIINGRDTDDSVVITVGDNPRGVAVDGAGSSSGLVYVVNQNSRTVSVIARVSPSVSSPSGSVGSAVTISVSAPQVAYDLDDSTIDSISIGGVTATGLAAGVGDTWTVTAPAGTGTVPVEVTFAGGLVASAGTFTYPSDPPAPVVPPSAPRDVTAVAGEGQATLSWIAPASSGSFAITDYEAVVSPGGQSCVVTAPTLSCAITGLTDGVTYTARVRALNGAGWGVYSDASPPFTPGGPVVQTIMITGERGDVRGRPGVQVTGETSGFDVGARLRPWHRFPGQTGFIEGTATIRVQEQGDFTWQRRTGKTITVVVRSMDGSVESNRLILRVS